MLAKLAREMPTGRRPLYEAEVGRLPLHRVPRRRRRRARQPQREAAHPVLPGPRRAAAAALPDRAVVDGEIVITTDARPRLRPPLAAHPPGASRRSDARGGDAGRVRRVRPARRGRRRTCASSRSRDRRARLEAGARAGNAPVHLTPATTRPRPAAHDWFEPVRGRRARRGRRQGRSTGRTSEGERRLAQGEAPAHRRLRRRRLPHAQGRQGRRLAAARALRRRRASCTTSASRRASRGTAARRAARRSSRRTGTARSTGTRGGSGPSGRPRSARGGGAEPGARSRWNANKDMIVGAAAHRARRRGRVRAHAGRPVPPHRAVPALAPDREPTSCTYEQLEVPVPMELQDVFGLAGDQSTGSASDGAGLSSRVEADMTNTEDPKRGSWASLDRGLPALREPAGEDDEVYQRATDATSAARSAADGGSDNSVRQTRGR